MGKKKGRHYLFLKFVILDKAIIHFLVKNFSTSKKLLFLCVFPTENLKHTLDFYNFKGNFLLK